MRISYKFLALGMYCLISLPLFSQGMYLELNLNETHNNHFARPKRPLEVFRVIERASHDNNVRGIILNISSISTSREHLWELRSALERFRASGKKVIAFISNANLDVYTLASVADKIVMDELGTLTMFGYVAGRGYVHNTLEKLGIGVREMRFFEYKTAAEMFSRDSMSEADRRQYNDFLDDIFNLTRDTLMKARGWSEDEFDSILRDFLFSARSAHNRGLVDFVGRKEAVQEAIRAIEGTDVTRFALHGDSASSVTGIRANYFPQGAGLFRSFIPEIAVVYASGQTDMHRGMNAVRLAKIIRELADRRQVKAIVIRIDSPGGSAEAANHFNEAVRYARERKPVVVSMESVAASGGYWAAMNATHIMATPYTVTGSIGVIGGWFFDDGLAGRLGMSVDTIQRGESADLLSGIILPRRDLTDQEADRFREYIMDLYRVFVEKVAAARGMEIEQVEAVAQGRIFSGIRALEVGLIDSIGGLPDALRVARELAEIPQGRRVRYTEYPRLTFWERMLHTTSAIVNVRWATTSPLLFGELFLSEIRYRLENNGRVMPILPLEFAIR